MGIGMEQCVTRAQVWPVWQSYKSVIQKSEYEEQSAAVSK
jgi:hypothetical protein